MTRAPVPHLEAGERRLDGALAHYLVRVLRLRSGDRFVAFDPAKGVESEGITVWADDASLVVRFGPVQAGAQQPGPAISWIQALAKGDKCDAVVRDATELGATEVIVAVTQRSVVRLGAGRAADRRVRWTRIAQEAARQCGRSDVPSVDGPCPWEVALRRGQSRSARFCLWEGATEPIAPLLHQAMKEQSSLAFVCGPEGGLTEGEVEQARDLGFSVVSLGPLKLRTETVAAAVLGAVRIWTGGVR